MFLSIVMKRLDPRRKNKSQNLSLVSVTNRYSSLISSIIQSLGRRIRRNRIPVEHLPAPRRPRRPRRDARIRRRRPGHPSLPRDPFEATRDRLLTPNGVKSHPPPSPSPQNQNHASNSRIPSTSAEPEFTPSLASCQVLYPPLPPPLAGTPAGG